MSGVTRIHRKRSFGRLFPASRYEDPRGGRPSGLERNILRYRATEAALYLCYAQQIRDLMITDVFREADRSPEPSLSDPSEDHRLHMILSRLLTEAKAGNKISSEDADALRGALSNDRQQGKKLKVAFAYAMEIGMLSEAEADELKGLLEYRNDIAHRIHRVMSDVTRTSFVSEFVSFTGPSYKGKALERMRTYHRCLWDRAGKKLCLTLSMDGIMFELAERVFEDELKRLDRLIRKQIARDQQRAEAVKAELDLRGTELVGDLAPRFPANHRSRPSYGDDWLPDTGHLTKRGVEICYRLFDLGKSPMAVAYLMGMTLRSAERRKKSWLRAGGLQRERYEVERYDQNTLQLNNES